MELARTGQQNHMINGAFSTQHLGVTLIDGQKKARLRSEYDPSSLASLAKGRFWRFPRRKTPSQTSS